MRIRSQVMRMRSSANNVMRMGILLELRMKENEIIPARPDHQNVKKSENFSW